MSAKNAAGSEVRSGRSAYEIDMLNGPLFGRILVFALPLMASGVLQLLFNAADVVVVGRFTGPTALAAVGSTGSLINLLVSLFIGLSVGANVMVGRFYGAQDDVAVSETVHTSIAVSLIGGLILLIVGVTASRPILTLMSTPDDVIDQAATYMRILFIGVPMSMLYNFGSAILRSIGDTKRPLYYLTIAGVINVCLNLFFVIVLHMGVAGVALATILSQAFSMVLTIRCLMLENSSIHLDLKKIRIVPRRLIPILQIGLPAGLQGCIFSISNVLIQSSINSFGSTVMAGNTAASNIEGFVYTAMNAFYQSNLSFTSQNYGAGKTKRVDRVLFCCQVLVLLTGLILGTSAWYFGGTLLRIYNTDAEVIRYGLKRLSICCISYFLCGMMDTMVGSMRGIGYSLLPMVVSLIGACAFRIIWIFTIFQWNRTIETLYISYPISWALTFLAHFICYLIVRRKMHAEHAPQAQKS